LLILFGVARSLLNQGNNYTLIDDALEKIFIPYFD